MGTLPGNHPGAMIHSLLIRLPFSGFRDADDQGERHPAQHDEGLGDTDVSRQSGKCPGIIACEPGQRNLCSSRMPISSMSLAG